jgi:hypothetical protein
LIWGDVANSTFTIRVFFVLDEILWAIQFLK